MCLGFPKYCVVGYSLTCPTIELAIAETGDTNNRLMIIILKTVTAIAPYSGLEANDQNMIRNCAQYPQSMVLEFPRSLTQR